MKSYTKSKTAIHLRRRKSKKLVQTLEDKKSGSLQELAVLSQTRDAFEKLHRAIAFELECWMEPCIRMNTEFRNKAKSDFESNFYKLMNNSVFGKTMENLRNNIDVKIVRSWVTDKIRRLVASPSSARHYIFGNDDLGGIHMHKSKLLPSRPVYTGMTILERSLLLCMCMPPRSSFPNI